MKCQKSSIVIVCMSAVLIILTLRLFFTGDEAESVQVIGGAKQSYTSMYPELYAKPVTEYQYPDGDTKVAFLTFDDGPSNYTEVVLDELKEQGVKATFFVVGEYMSDTRIEYLKRIIEEGHTIGLHTYSHDYKKIYASVEAFLDDYDKLNTLLYEELGFKPNIYRFPGGSNNYLNTDVRDDIIKEMNRRGYTYYDWNISAEDSVGSPTKASIIKNITKDINQYQYPVVLMHDSESNALTAEMLPEIIGEFRERGFQFDTVEKREPLHF